MAGTLQSRAAASALRLLRIASDAGFRGPDPFDALWWPHWPAWMVSGPLRRTALVQLHARSPVDLRRLYRRAHPLIPKALAVFASTALRLEACGEGGGEARRRGTEALELLDADRAGGDLGWSYHWDAQTRWSFYPAGTPNIVVTVFAARALADGAEAWARPDWHERAMRAARWIRDELLRPSGFFAYHPSSAVLVHNANVLGARLVHDLLGETGVARRALELSLRAQRPDGSWPYGDGGNLEFVDNFHTGYVLESLCGLRALDPAIPDAVRRGARYWLDRFFLDDGTTTLWPGRRWPEDAHATGTALTTLSALVTAGFVDGRRLEAVARYAFGRMIDGDHAIARRYRLGRSRVAYIRWCDAHMALGLANAAATLAALDRGSLRHRSRMPSRGRDERRR
jgi:hypothetical protein